MVGEDDFAAGSRLDAKALGADGTRPSGPTLMLVRRLQTKGHPGQLGTGRSTERFSLSARFQACWGFILSSRWISCWLRWRRKAWMCGLAWWRSVMFSLAK